MKGKNRMVINDDTMRQALQFWLENTVMRGNKVVGVKKALFRSGQFELTLEEIKPAHDYEEVDQ